MTYNSKSEKLPDNSYLIEYLPDNIDCTRCSCRTGQIVSDCPKGVSSVGIIVSGRIDVYAVALDGKDVQLSSLTKGECFGICNLLASAELQTVLRCAEDTVIMYIPKDILLKALEYDANLAKYYAVLCNRKLQFLINRIELLTMQSCRGKIIAYLLTKKDNKNKVILQGSRDELASRLGVSRSALFRELSFLQSKGLIKAVGSTFKVLNTDVLEQLLYYSPNSK